MLFEPNMNLSNALIQDYLNCTEIPKLTKEQSQKCEGKITEEELLKVLKKMPRNKSPWNNGILRSMLGWPENTSYLSVNKAFKVEELSTSQMTY